MTFFTCKLKILCFSLFINQPLHILEQISSSMHISIFQKHPYRATASASGCLCVVCSWHRGTLSELKNLKRHLLLTNLKNVLFSENHLEQATLFTLKSASSLRLEELKMSSMSLPLLPVGWAPLHISTT